MVLGTFPILLLSTKSTNLSLVFDFGTCMSETWHLLFVVYNEPSIKHCNKTNANAVSGAIANQIIQSAALSTEHNEHSITHCNKTSASANLITKWA